MVLYLLLYKIIMTNKRRQFIDRLLRISEINQQLFDIGDKGRQPAFTKRITLVQMGKAEFNLPPPAPAVHSTKHNCKVLVIQKPTNRYLSQKHTRTRTADGDRSETTQISPAKREVQYCKLKLDRKRSTDACIEHEYNQINFVAPLQYQPKINLFKNPEQTLPKRPLTSYKTSRRIASSSKNICLNDSQTTDLSSLNIAKSSGISGKSLKFHRTNTMNFERDKKAQQERKAKIQKMKEINKNYAGPFNPPPRISAKSYIVCEVVSGSLKPVVCYNSKNSQEVASLTKIMTCIVAIELAQRLKADIDSEQIRIGKYESSIGGTSAGVKAGQIYTVRQLLYGLMLPSGNDASLALAVWAGRKLLQNSSEAGDSSARRQKLTKGTCYARFIQEMNDKAKVLNMSKTRYANSHGLANTNNRSTAYDIALLSSYAMQHPLFRQVVSTRSYYTTIKYLSEGSFINQNQTQSNQGQPQFDEFIEQARESPEKTDSRLSSYKSKSVSKTQMVEVGWQNTHKLLQSKPGQYIGIKTGITSTAGPCLSSMITIQKRQFIIIVLACLKVGLRFKQTQILKRWLYKHFGITKIRKTSSLKQEKATQQGPSESEDDDNDNND